jgi:hypothetical protein
VTLHILPNYELQSDDSVAMVSNLAPRSSVLTDIKHVVEALVEVGSGTYRPSSFAGTPRICCHCDIHTGSRAHLTRFRVGTE